MALLQTPHRFRTKRQVWAYSGFVVQTHDSGEYRYVRGKPQRNRAARIGPMRTTTLWSIAAAMMWFAGTVLAQDLHREALVKALQKGGYVLVMRHASSPREVPDKQPANPDHSQPERQLDEVGRNTAIAIGKALSDLRIPIGNVLSSPTYRALETVGLAQFGAPQIFAELGDNGQGMQGGTTAQAECCRSKWHTFQPARTRSL